MDLFGIAFAEWGIEMKRGRIYFEPLMDRGTYGYDDYLERAVHLPGNPRHGEYPEIIRHPTFENGYVQVEK